MGSSRPGAARSLRRPCLEGWILAMRGTGVKGRLRHLVPHPSRPGSMVALVALPTFLMFLTLAWVVPYLFPIRPHLPAVSGSRIPNGRQVRELADGLASGTAEERGQKVLALAVETQHCPGYASYTVPR